MIEKYMRHYKWADGKRKRRKCLYLLVTTDKYRLPLVVTDTIAEMAEVVGVNQATISKCLNSGYKNSRYERVYIDEEDDDE